MLVAELLHPADTSVVFFSLTQLLSNILWRQKFIFKYILIIGKAQIIAHILHLNSSDFWICLLSQTCCICGLFTGRTNNCSFIWKKRYQNSIMSIWWKENTSKTEVIKTPYTNPAVYPFPPLLIIAMSAGSIISFLFKRREMTRQLKRNQALKWMQKLPKWKSIFLLASAALSWVLLADSAGNLASERV